MATTTATQIQQLYVGLLGRAADQGGLNWWADQVTTGGKTLEDVRASFVTSTEYTTTYGAATTRADLVTSIYQNLFERTPSADEVKYWAETDTRPADQLVAAFIEFAGAADQAVINNKTFVAQTYTDTVGDTNFDKAGAAEAIANVDGTSASVSTAIDAINNGSLAGQVPALGLITASADAAAAVDAYATANQTALDALLTKLDVASTDDFAADVESAYEEAQAVRGNGDSTAILQQRASEFATKATAAYNELSATDKPLADALNSASAKLVTADAAKATDAEYASAVAGLDADTTATAALGADGLDATAAEVYSDYVNASTPTARADIDAALKGTAFYSTFKAAVVKDAAYADALKAQDSALAALDNDTGAAATLETLHGAVVVTGKADSTAAASAKAQAYVTALNNKVVADEAVTDAKAADVDVASTKALYDAYISLVEKAETASGALDQFNEDNAGTAALHDLGNSLTGSEAVKDVFYFGAKPDGPSDHTIAANNFGSGDSIVIGSGATYNSGALTTGDNNKVEFFLVQKGNDTLVILETDAFGSSTTTHTATGDAVAVGSDNAAVITLTGVAVTDLTVNNGVISHVAAAAVA